MNKSLTELLRRADNWPESARAELEEIAAEIEAELTAGSYHPTAAERAGIERGLSDAAQGKFASESDVEATFAKHRRS
jgi:predicted transcriptional regulator